MAYLRSSQSGETSTSDWWGFPAFVIVALAIGVGLTVLQIYMQNPG